MTKAEKTVAARMANPLSAEFADVWRVSNPIDFVCGTVKGKRASDGKEGVWAFLYVVDEQRAYLIGDNPDTVAGISYRNICGEPRFTKAGRHSGSAKCDRSPRFSHAEHEPTAELSF